ncbi:MAG: hypothetical protein LBJ62_05605 [Bifidobacteriaceae bacterium]|nr:hypothetical protein [Bifidobacteriaceae bacterium]
MMKRTVRASALSVIALAMALSLGACGDGGTSGGDDTSADVQESAAFIADMQEGVKIINDQLEVEPGMEQIMLASDVDHPTQKYNLWVMPYYPSEAVTKYTMTIQIKDGKDFHVTAVSADTGKTWRMDQDGKMTEELPEDG